MSSQDNFGFTSTTEMNDLNNRSQIGGIINHNPSGYPLESDLTNEKRVKRFNRSGIMEQRKEEVPPVYKLRVQIHSTDVTIYFFIFSATTRIHDNREFKANGLGLLLFCSREGFFLAKQSNEPVGLTAQLVEHRTRTAEVRV